MRVLATSDLHGNLPDLPACDLLLLVGDICPDYDTWNQGVNCNRQLNWLQDEFADWLHFLDAGKVIAIAGNHDFVFEVMPQEVDDLNLRWTYLNGTAIDYEGLTIFGSPYVPNLPNWAFYKQDYQFVKHWDLIPNGCDILMTHGPPRNYGDIVGPKYGGPLHVGEKFLEEALHRVRPTVHFCGHIHEANGHYEHDAVEMGIYNVAFVDENYEPSNEPIEITLGE